MGILKKNIPGSILEDHYDKPQKQRNDKREVVLSEYLVGGDA